MVAQVVRGPVSDGSAVVSRREKPIYLPTVQSMVINFPYPERPYKKVARPLEGPIRREVSRRLRF